MSAIEIEFELQESEATGVARARAIAAATAIGARHVVLPLALAEAAASADARAAVASARAAKLAVTLPVQGGALAGRCPNDAATLQESATRAQAAAALGADALELVGFGFPAGDSSAPPAARFLAALCSCSGCLRRLAARQLDGAKLVAKARALAQSAREAAEGGTALARAEEIGPWLVKQLGAKELAALLATRKEALAAMVQEVRKRLAGGAVLRAIVHPSPFVGGRALGGGLLALSDWLDGFTLDAAGTAAGEGAAAGAAIKSARTAALPTSRFTARLAAPAASAASATLPTLLRAIVKEGVSGVRLVSDGRCADAEVAAWKAALSGAAKK